MQNCCDPRLAVGAVLEGEARGPAPEGSGSW